MRAKFVCQSVISTDWGNTEPEIQVKLNAVHGGTSNTEDNEFSSYTPSGSISMLISNPKAQGFLKPGKKYYVDFTEAKD